MLRPTRCWKRGTRNDRAKTSNEKAAASLRMRQYRHAFTFESLDVPDMHGHLEADERNTDHLRQARLALRGYLQRRSGREVPGMSAWISVKAALPKEGVPVKTKVDDSGGVRRKATLVRRESLWLSPDMSMYVYYKPTHWREL